jgi:hypothetical protein
LGASLHEASQQSRPHLFLFNSFNNGQQRTTMTPSAVIRHDLPLVQLKSDVRMGQRWWQPFAGWSSVYLDSKKKKKIDKRN